MRTKKQEKNGPVSEARMPSVQRGHCGSPSVVEAHWACRRTAPHVRGEETALQVRPKWGRATGPPGWLGKVTAAQSLFATPWTVTHQAPLSMGFSRQECRSGLPCPSPGDVPDPGIQIRSPAFQGDSLPSEPAERAGW